MNLEQKNAILTVRGDKNKFAQRVIKDTVPEQDMPELLKVVYDKDKRTGWPCNDIELMESKRTPSEIRSALERQNRIIPNNEVASDNDDSVLAGVQRNNETDDEYVERMRNRFKDT